MQVLKRSSTADIFTPPLGLAGFQVIMQLVALAWGYSLQGGLANRGSLPRRPVANT